MAYSAPFMGRTPEAGPAATASADPISRLDRVPAMRKIVAPASRSPKMRYVSGSFPDREYPAVQIYDKQDAEGPALEGHTGYRGIEGQGEGRRSLEHVHAAVRA